MIDLLAIAVRLRDEAARMAKSAEHGSSVMWRGIENYIVSDRDIATLNDIARAVKQTGDCV